MLKGIQKRSIYTDGDAPVGCASFKNTTNRTPKSSVYSVVIVFQCAPLHFVASSALASLSVYLWTATNGQSFFVFQNYFPENMQKHREYQNTQ